VEVFRSDEQMDPFVSIKMATWSWTQLLAQSAEPGRVVWSHHQPPLELVAQMVLRVEVSSRAKLELPSCVESVPSRRTSWIHESQPEQLLKSKVSARAKLLPIPTAESSPSWASWNARPAEWTPSRTELLRSRRYVICFDRRIMEFRIVAVSSYSCFDTTNIESIPTYIPPFTVIRDRFQGNIPC
jgi:hypothetical protein